MTQDEILTRAREAYIKIYAYSLPAAMEDVRAGGRDECLVIQALIIALADAHRPLSEIVPPDPDLIAAREWGAGRWPVCAKRYLDGHLDGTELILGFLAGCRHARGGDK